MEEQVVKKRAWVKNAVIVFLSIMLVLTFFSNTIMNRSLPEVATAYVESGSINAKIRGSGTVSAGESYEVIMDQTRQVASVLVRVGDTVQVGDVLFTLAEAQSDELKQAQDVLADMRLNYEKSLLNMDTADYSQDNRNIQKAREALAEAQAQMNGSAVTDQQLYDAQAVLKEQERLLKDLNESLEDEKLTFATAKADYEAYKLQIPSDKQLETLEKAIEDLEDQIADLEYGVGDPDRELNKAKSRLTAAEKSYAELRITHGTHYDSLKEKAANISSSGNLVAQMQALIDSSSTDASLSATAAEKAAFENLQPVIDEIDSLSERIKTLQALADGQESVYEQIDNLQDALDDKEDELSDLRSEIKASSKKLSSLEDDMDAAEQMIEYLEFQVESYQDTVQQLTEQYDALKELRNDHDSAKETVKDLQDNLDELLFQLAQKKKADGKLAASQQLDLDKAQQDILEQEELIAELQANALGGEVVAAVSGQISTLNVSAGRDAAAGETLAVIEVVDRGYTVRIPVTLEQSKKVRLGDKAEISNYYWGEQLDVTLSQIVNDPANPGKGKLLVFTITGDVSSGQNVTVSVGEKSASFDSIIPNSALRTDTNGTFVLAVLAKSSPLGNRYIATRVDVQVLAQDDTTAAVSGLSMGDYVITTSSKPLEAGMQVNIVEN